MKLKEDLEHKLVITIDKEKTIDKCVHYWICKTVGDHTEQTCKYCGEFIEVKSQFVNQMHGRSY
jgi:hypothetical protein